MKNSYDNIFNINMKIAEQYPTEQHLKYKYKNARIIDI